MAEAASINVTYSLPERLGYGAASTESKVMDLFSTALNGSMDIGRKLLENKLLRPGRTTLLLFDRNALSECLVKALKTAICYKIYQSSDTEVKDTFRGAVAANLCTFFETKFDIEKVTTFTTQGLLLSVIETLSVQLNIPFTQDEINEAVTKAAEGTPFAKK